MTPEPPQDENGTFGTGQHRMTELEHQVLGEQDWCKEMALELYERTRTDH